VPDTIDAVLTYPEGFTVTLGCTLNSTGGEEGVHIHGTKGTLHLLGDRLRLTIEPGGDDNRWVVRSWPEALERAYYDDPKVQAIETPGAQRQQASVAGEEWAIRGEDEDIAHVRSFVGAVRSRKPPVEDARFGHRAAAVAHYVNQAIREGKSQRFEI
jgi:hypothetical protein